MQPEHKGQQLFQQTDTLAIWCQVCWIHHAAKQKSKGSMFLIFLSRKQEALSIMVGHPQTWGKLLVASWVGRPPMMPQACRNKKLSTFWTLR